MNKIKLAIIILLILITISVALFIVIQPTKKISSANNLINQPTPIQISQQNIVIPVSNSVNGVTIKNFLKPDQIKLSNGDIIIDDKPQQYQVTYTPYNGHFSIYISGSFTALRSIAEKDLLNMLNIHNIDACKLSIQIKTSDPVYANDHYFLTLCSPKGERAISSK